MKRPRGIHLAAAFFAALFLIAVFADFLSSNPPEMQDLDQFYHAPTKIHFRYKPGQNEWKPFIYKSELSEPLDALYKEIPDQKYPLQFFFKGYRYTVLGLFSSERHLVGRSQYPRYYPLGTDELGRDVLARVLAGTRTSLLVVGLGIFFYAAIGLAVGVFAGLFGGWVDSVLMRLSEFVLALPVLYLLLALRSLLPMRTPFLQTLVWVVGAIAVVAWPPMARGVRGIILQVRNSVYVEASRSLGATPAHVFLHHILPSLVPFVLAQLTLAAPVFLLGEIVLSFLNVGFQESGESWGAMLRSLKDTRVLTDFWWNLVPLCMVFFTLLSLNILSSGKSRQESEDQIMRI
jgi:peptide/nickel transport system permease protein